MVWGLSSFGFHVTNGILHIIAVALFYGWCTRALADESSRTRHLGTLWPEWPAFFAASIFAFHPVIASTVVYVSARSELLCAIGSLAALMLARRAIATASRPAALLAIAFGIAAVGSSSSAAALPLLVLAYDAWILRDDGWRRRMWRIYLPATALIAVAAALRLPAILGADRVPPRGLIENLVVEATVAWRYIGLLLIPRGLALVHDVHWVVPWHPLGLASLALLAGGVAAAIRIRRSYPLVAFGVLWFVAVLAPTSSVIPVRDVMVEKRVYLAAAGLLLATASALARPLATKRLARGIGTALLAVLIVLTYTRNARWSDLMGMWEDTVRRAPGAWQAHLGYADLLREIHRCDRAIGEYREVLRLHPEHPAAVAGMRACH